MGVSQPNRYKLLSVQIKKRNSEEVVSHESLCTQTPVLKDLRKAPFNETQKRILFFILFFFHLFFFLLETTPFPLRHYSRVFGCVIQGKHHVSEADLSVSPFTSTGLPALLLELSQYAKTLIEEQLRIFDSPVSKHDNWQKWKHSGVVSNMVERVFYLSYHF